MSLRSVFEFESYKKILANRLSSAESRGQLSRAAEALNCQPSFLSRVIKSEIHLTPDHAFLLTEFFRLNSDEADYFQTLVECERASNPKFKSVLRAKAVRLRTEHESLESRVQQPDFSVPQQQALYFSTWCWSAIHFLVSIPEFQTVRALAARLGISEAMVQVYLKQLATAGMVRENRKGWEYAGGEFHIAKNSPFVVLHHQNWRGRAVLDAQNPANQNIHFTNVISLSRDDFSRLKELMLQFISDSERIAGPSNPEECAIITCDLFLA